jgi:hypothetical protein
MGEGYHLTKWDVKWERTQHYHRRGRLRWIVASSSFYIKSVVATGRKARAMTRNVRTVESGHSFRGGLESVFDPFPAVANGGRNAAATVMPGSYLELGAWRSKR